MTKKELKTILKKHGMWLRDEEGGERADLRGADLSGSNFSNADLSDTYLCNTYLCNTYLCNTKLCNTNLSNTNLSNADLSNADLRGADLMNCIGNGREIKTIHVEKYIVNYTKDVIQIGCENHTIGEWRKFTDNEIKVMDCGALEWWRKWKDTIFKIIEMSPAE